MLKQKLIIHKSILSADNMMIVMREENTKSGKAANKHKKNGRIGMAGRRMLSPKNCARD